ncbi:MAG: hypothetical protein ACFFG0_29890 [Candidatus Thorarchaeota archaeon]
MLVTLREPFPALIASHQPKELHALGTLRTFSWERFEDILEKLTLFAA